uniref:Uncharacterized protein n=1 Tax=Romanomermis culicivorax TaxID=13658 RepID=A0A915IHQ1_ROMCU
MVVVQEIPLKPDSSRSLQIFSKTHGKQNVVQQLAFTIPLLVEEIVATWSFFREKVATISFPILHDPMEVP